ncbi:MAG: hypothetical protein IPP32_05010 [Bacteroidetes bacterium]|nr:hypothetical protein [Bacteroidota bacterium]
MKKYQKILLVCLTVAAVMPSCKKGEDDPFLSLRSRKGRVAGDWTVESKIDTRTDLTTGSTTTITINGSDYTRTSNGTFSSTTKGTIGAFTYTFEKDGKWNSVYELTTVNTSGSGGSATTTTTTKHVESSGIWNFLGKIGEAKNKENMSVSKTLEITRTTTKVENPIVGTSTGESTQTDTFGENESVEIWKLTQLKNKELKAEMKIDNSSTSPTNVDRETGSVSFTLKQ